MYNTYGLLGRIFVFVNINTVHPLQHAIIIVKPTADTRIVREDSSQVLDHQITQNTVSHVITCDVHQ